MSEQMSKQLLTFWAMLEQYSSIARSCAITGHNQSGGHTQTCRWMYQNFGKLLPTSLQALESLWDQRLAQNGKSGGKYL